MGDRRSTNKGARRPFDREDADRGRAFDEFYGAAATAVGDERRLRAEREAFLREAGPAMPADALLENDEVVTAGSGAALRVVRLAGHTGGSVGLYWEQESILFAVSPA